MRSCLLTGCSESRDILQRSVKRSHRERALGYGAKCGHPSAGQEDPNLNPNPKPESGVWVVHKPDVEQYERRLFDATVTVSVTVYTQRVYSEAVPVASLFVIFSYSRHLAHPSCRPFYLFSCELID